MGCAYILSVSAVSTFGIQYTAAPCAPRGRPDCSTSVIEPNNGALHIQVSWGVDLASEHERYLTEEVFKQPVIVYNYPKEIKASPC